VLLIWVYYSAQIFLLGAEFTWVYAHTFGSLRGRPLPGAAPPTRFTRIDLRMDRTWQPGVYIAGSADLRRVGVQLGEPRVFRR